MEPTPGIEQTKEFDMKDILAVRFEGPAASVSWRDAEKWLVTCHIKKLEGRSPIALVGMEAKGYVGMATFRIEEDGMGGVVVMASGMLDYQSPERLLLENGELALDLDIRLGGERSTSVPLDFDGLVAPTAITVRGAQLKQVPVNSVMALKIVPMSWMF